MLPPPAQNKRRGLAGRCLSSLEDAVGRAEARPATLPQMKPGIRKCRLTTFPYALISRGDQDIDVIAVMHLRRPPGYWRGPRIFRDPLKDRA